MIEEITDKFAVLIAKAARSAPDDGGYKEN